MFSVVNSMEFFDLNPATWEKQVRLDCFYDKYSMRLYLNIFFFKFNENTFISIKGNCEISNSWQSQNGLIFDNSIQIYYSGEEIEIPVF